MPKKIKGSLGLKTAATIAVSTLIGILCFVLLSTFGRTVVEKAYTARRANAERLEAYNSDFLDYVNPDGKSCDSVSKMQEWLVNKPSLTLYLYDMSSGQLFFESDGHFSTTYSRGESDTILSPDAEYICLVYKDVECRAVLRDNSYTDYYNIVDIAAIFLSVLVAFALTFIRFRQLVKRILKLSKQVKAVTYGDTEREIKIGGDDEISELSENIDSMRKSIIEYYEMEQNAIKANNDLLTSISHDIRTPLTSIIGYSELMADERTTDVSEMKKYAAVCKEKAYRLKELTDTMFRYFYVYGKDDTDIRFEKYDASQLFIQLLGEHVVDLMQEGFTAEVAQELQEKADICIDIELFSRVVENVFSNFKKYADKEKTITVSSYTDGENVVVGFTNTVMSGGRQAESTKIGLRTCSKIMSQMNGRFEVTKDGRRFIQKIVIPLIK